MKSEKFLFLFLMAPAFAFLALFYLVPIFSFLPQAFLKDSAGDILAQTYRQIALDKGQAEPTDDALKVLFSDLRSAARSDVGQLAHSVGSSSGALRIMLLKTSAEARKTDELPEDIRAWFAAIDDLWLQESTWKMLEAEGQRFTLRYLSITAPWGNRAAEQIQFSEVFMRTIGVATGVAALCFLIAAPAAYSISVASGRTARMMIACVLVSLWTSILVRTLSWIIIFQNEGVLTAIGRALFSSNLSYGILGTRSAVIVGMVHLLLPYMILSLHEGLKRIPIQQYFAATSLGASTFRAVLLVYLPQMRPAITAGLSIVITLTLGFYLTPLLLGGPQDQLLAYYTAFFAQRMGDWHVSAALSVWLTLLVAGFALTGAALSPAKNSSKRLGKLV